MLIVLMLNELVMVLSVMKINLCNMCYIFLFAVCAKIFLIVSSPIVSKNQIRRECKFQITIALDKLFLWEIKLASWQVLSNVLDFESRLLIGTASDTYFLNPVFAHASKHSICN